MCYGRQLYHQGDRRRDRSWRVNFTLGEGLAAGYLELNPTLPYLTKWPDGGGLLEAENSLT